MKDQTKPPQCLKLNFKDNLSLLSPPQCIRLCKLWGEGGSWQKIMTSFFTVLLYLYDYGPDTVDSVKIGVEMYEELLRQANTSD